MYQNVAFLPLQLIFLSPFKTSVSVFNSVKNELFIKLLKFKLKLLTFCPSTPQKRKYLSSDHILSVVVCPSVCP